jgi:cysteinyl-tRNA synthetase
VPDRILDALCDDLNTPQAIAELNALVNLAMKEEGEARSALTGELVAALDLLGLLPRSLADWRYGAGGGDAADLPAETVESLIEESKDARKNINFSRADEIRDELSAKGVILEDTPTGTIWRRGA